MALILTRSPYFVSRGNLDDGASLVVEIGYYDFATLIVEKTYTFNYRNGYLIDIAPFIDDYLSDTFSWQSIKYSTDRGETWLKYVRTTLSGEVSGVAQSDVVNEYFASKGYLYSTDEYNEDLSQKLVDDCYYAGSSDVIYKLDDSQLRFSLMSTDQTLIAGDTGRSVDITYKNNGEAVKSETYSFSSTSSFNNYTFKEEFLGFGIFDSYERRVKNDGGIVEDSKCLQDFFDDREIFDYDEIVLAANGTNKVIKVNTVSECKHKPYRVTFLNKYGAQEDLWFFKRSDVSMVVQKETFRPSSIGRYNASTGFTLNTPAVKTYSDFNINARESIRLNTDWVDEKLNESIRQMMLSDYIRLWDFTEDKIYHVNVKSSDLTFKTHVNDKLINYEIEFDFAHEVINNVG